MAASDQEPHGPLGLPPSRGDKRRYFLLMGICIGLFVISWAVIDRYSVVAAVICSIIALVIPPFAAIIANVTSAADRRRP
jgi:lipopolysaccharide export LptBFGC system permease protein LptF